MADSEHTYKEPKDCVAEARTAEAFEAGYKARLAGVPECHAATSSWQAGWQEADRETAGSGTAETVQINTDVRTPWSLFGTGKEARICDLPFDELCPDTWKRSWVEADITIGLVKRQAAL